MRWAAAGLRPPPRAAVACWRTAPMSTVVRERAGAPRQAGWSPFQRARTLLLHGERLPPDPPPGRAPADRLREAIVAFDAWARRRGPIAPGPSSRRAASAWPRRDLTAPERLTTQELQIALQVAAGRSNRDVAAALYMSPKTVEYHLTHVYRKLDLHSRAELVRLFAGQDGGATPAPGGTTRGGAAARTT